MNISEKVGIVAIATGLILLVIAASSLWGWGIGVGIGGAALMCVGASKIS
jgi:hypothetical protein